MPDALPFLRAWFSEPLRVGAVVPSGAALADIITSEIVPQTAPVLELGPGTGVFTQALLACGLSQGELTLVECGAEFAALLETRFPGVHVVRTDAARLGRPGLFESGSFGATVSGLPLLSMRPRKVITILAGAFACLRPGGAFYQFTYGPRCPVPRPILDRLGLKAVPIGRTLLNVPPATVYRFARRGPMPISVRQPGSGVSANLDESLVSHAGR